MEQITLQSGLVISIHAPRVGSDYLAPDNIDFPRISIHAPRVGSDGLLFLFSAPLQRFQSTLPVWGATAKIHKKELVYLFNIVNF